MVTAPELVGLLAEPERLRVAAAVVLGAGSPREIAVITTLDVRDVVRAVNRLTAGGLVSVADGRLVIDSDVFKQAARSAAAVESPEDHGVSDPYVAAVLRAFVRNGRLVGMPAARGKRRIVLDHVVMSFEPGVRYPESEVNAVLRAWYGDYVSLRRYLVDEGLLSRDAGEYWRSGGWVAV